MKRRTLVSPSILSGDFAQMGRAASSAEEWGADWIHCDVMDGAYVPNITFGMPMISALRKTTSLPLDVHLMIDRPERYAKRFCDAGASAVTFHPDASDDPESALGEIRRAGVKCGLAFNPNVDHSRYLALFDRCDLIVVMTVYAGYGGQKLIEERLDAVRSIRDFLDSIGSDADIEVDGGVNAENAAEVRSSGASVLVAGSAVYGSPDPAETIRILRGE